MVSPRIALLAALQLALASASPAPATDAAASDEPLPPKQDPWYTAPDGWEGAAPGDILRSRVAPGGLVDAVGVNCSAAHNVLYRTTDSLGGATWAVTTLFAPLGRSPCSMPPAGWGSLLSYQIPYDSANLDMSPSYQMYTSPPADIADALGRGWYVNVPDYEGPLASFTAGAMSGQATLDSVRAVRAAGDLGVSQDARYALWGYSGGALASEWAAELQPTYAPELSFAGAALGGLTPNVTSVLVTVSGTLGSSLAPQGILGLVSQHPDAAEVVLGALKESGPRNKTGFLAAYNLSSTDAFAVFAGVDIDDYFTDGFAFLDDSTVQDTVNQDGIMGRHGVPQMPVYAYKAVADEISLIEDTDALVAQYCDSGASILYDRNSVGGHSAEASNGEAAAVSFLESVLQGKWDMAGCETRNVTIAVSTSPLRRPWAPNVSNRAR